MGTDEFSVVGFEISNVWVDGAANNGIFIWNSSRGVVLGNRVSNCDGWGIEELGDESNDNLILGNWLHLNGGTISYVGPQTEVVRNWAQSGVAMPDSGGFRQTIDGWNQDNVTASQTDVELTRTVGRFRAVRAGSVTGVVVTSSEARTNGTLTVTVWKNAGLAGATTGPNVTSLGFSAVLDATNTSRHAATQGKDIDVFFAGDELFLRVTTTGTWTPTSADIRCAIEIED